MESTTRKTEKGFSLLELMIVLIVIGLLAAFTIPAFRHANNAGSGARVQNRLIQIVEERKTSAVRLNQSAINGGDRPDQPVVVNFSDLTTTASLKTDGADADHNGIEDVSGVRITRWGILSTTGRKGWLYAYEGLPVQLPDTWVIAESVADLGTIPEIPNSELTAVIRFDALGKPVGEANPTNPPPGRDEAPFYVVYARDTGAGNIAVAVAVHGSGLTEKWTYNFEDEEWHGRGGRR